jgi:hypothetical protein
VSEPTGAHNKQFNEMLFFDVIHMDMLHKPGDELLCKLQLAHRRAFLEQNSAV